jgi:hypothetical protein
MNIYLVGEVSPCLRPPAASSDTPSWVRPGTIRCKIHPSVGRTRGEQLIRKKYLFF